MMLLAGEHMPTAAPKGGRAIVIAVDNGKGTTAAGSSAVPALLPLSEALEADGGPVSLPKGLRWRKRCPVAFDKLTPTAVPGVDMCNVCSKAVYLCSSLTDVVAHVQKGNCVSFSKALLDARNARVDAERARENDMIDGGIDEGIG